MPLTVSDSKPFVTDIPEDEYIAVCIGVFDVGTVHSEKFGKDSERVLFLFEIPELKDPEGWPKTTNKEYTASLDPKSNLYKDVISWRGKGFAPGEMKNFSLKSFLGKPASLLIVHNRGKGDRADNVYANIQQIRNLQKGVVAPAPSREPLFFDFADGVASIPEGTPEFIQKKIMSAPEWTALKTGRPMKPGSPAAPAAKPGQQAPEGVVDLISQMGLDWPYNDDDLDAAFKPELFTQEQYDFLKSFSVPF